LEYVRVEDFHAGDYEECRFCYIRTQFVLHRKHVTSTLQTKQVNAM
jgi:hypothetical protein